MNESYLPFIPASLFSLKKWKYLLFSLKGRVPRSPFWAFMGVWLTVNMVIVFNMPGDPILGKGAVIMIFAGYAVVSWKRVQDIGWPGWIAVLPFLVGLVDASLMQSLMAPYFILLGLIGSQPGSNKYGPSPHAGHTRIEEVHQNRPEPKARDNREVLYSLILGLLSCRVVPLSVKQHFEVIKAFEASQILNFEQSDYEKLNQMPSRRQATPLSILFGSGAKDENPPITHFLTACADETLEETYQELEKIENASISEFCDPETYSVLSKIIPQNVLNPTVVLEDLWWTTYKVFQPAKIHRLSIYCEQFDDLKDLSGSTIQELLRGCEHGTWSRALFMVPSDVIATFHDNMSEAAWDLMMEDFEEFAKTNLSRDFIWDEQQVVMQKLAELAPELEEQERKDNYERAITTYAIRCLVCVLHDKGLLGLPEMPLPKHFGIKLSKNNVYSPQRMGQTVEKLIAEIRAMGTDYPKEKVRDKVKEISNNWADPIHTPFLEVYRIVKEPFGEEFN